MQVWDGSQWAAIRAAQQRTVLALLLIESGRAVTSERLIDQIWEGRPPATAMGTIQGYVLRLRRLLGDDQHSLLATQGHGYQLMIEDDDLDVAVFERLVESGRQRVSSGDLETGVAELVEALALWRGAPLADILPCATVMAQARRLVEVHLTALEECLGAQLELGHHGDVVDQLGWLVREHPLRETLWRHLLLALHRCGRRAEALDAYQRARKLLAAELGVEPDKALRELHTALLTEDPRLGSAPPKAPRQQGFTPVVPAQLPADPAAFIGRREQLDRLDALLALEGLAPVIVTVVGPAGVGKTALALRWAHRIADRFDDGHMYVNLRGFDPGGSPMAPAEALRRFLGTLNVPTQHIPADPDAQAALYRSLLAGKKILILLDNARDPAQVRALLPGAPGCLVLITSRSDMSGLVATDGAHPLTLDLLTDAEANGLLSHRLGVDRVAAEPDAVEQLVTACARLPLALAIVAARATAQRHLPLAALAHELHDRQSRLDALSTGEATTDVRTVFSWSYHALSSAPARLFRLLGLHTGPDISDAAAASLAALPPPRARALLAELTRANLLIEHVLRRYTFHDLLHAYATQVADDIDTDDERRNATHRLLDHYLHTAYAAKRLLAPARDTIHIAQSLPGVIPEALADDEQALEWFTTERHVLLAAVGWAAATGFDAHAWQLALSLDDFLDRRGHWHDLVNCHQTAAAAAERLGDRVAQARAHRLLARACTRLNRLDDARVQLLAALDLSTRAGDLAGQAHTHQTLAHVWERQDRHAEALTHCQQALDLFRAVGHQSGQADALNGIGWLHALLGDHRRAIAYCRQALPLYQEIGDRRGQAATWDSLGYAHHHLGQYPQAVEGYQQAINLCRDDGDRYEEAVTMTRLGDTHNVAGSLNAARVAWQQALATLTDLHHPDAEHVRAKLARLGAGAGVETAGGQPGPPLDRAS